MDPLVRLLTECGRNDDLVTVLLRFCFCFQLTGPPCLRRSLAWRQEWRAWTSLARRCITIGKSTYIHVHNCAILASPKSLSASCSSLQTSGYSRSFRSVGRSNYSAVFVFPRILLGRDGLELFVVCLSMYATAWSRREVKFTDTVHTVDCTLWHLSTAKQISKASAIKIWFARLSWKMYNFLTTDTHDWFLSYTEFHSIRLKFEQFSFLKPEFFDIHSKNYSVHTYSHGVKKTVTPCF